MTVLSSILPASAARRRQREPMFATAASLMTSTVVTNALGVLFWTLAARLYSPTVVGRDVALVSLMIQVSTLGQLDLANIVVRFLPAARGDRRRLIAQAYVVAVGTTALLAVLATLVIGQLGGSLRFLTLGSPLGLVVVVATALWSVFAIQDGVLTALGGARWVWVENAAFGVLKLAAVVALAGAGSPHGPFLAFAISMAALLIPVNLLLFGRVVPQAPAPTEEAVRGAAFGRRRLLLFVAQDYAGSVFAAAALTVLPLLVVGLLGSRSNAFFYLPLLIVLALDTLFANACTSLVAAGSAQVSRQTELARLMTRRAVVLLVPAALLLALVAPWVLRVFGAEYADNATTLMRLLAVACVPRAAHSLFAALARLRGDGRAILWRQGLSVALLLAGTVLLAPPLGLTGVALAWLGASVVVLLTVLPGLVRTLR